MDETPSPASSSQDAIPRNGSLRKKKKKSRRQAADYDGGADPIECTGKSCRSCTAGLIADCVAVCCCPCAVVDILFFTFLKIPYLMGRKWLTRGKKKMRGLEKKKRKCEISTNSDRVVNIISDDGLISRTEVAEGPLKDAPPLMESGDEEVWLELYRNGHLGFGRVSFTGIPSQDKGN